MPVQGHLFRAFFDPRNLLPTGTQFPASPCRHTCFRVAQTAPSAFTRAFLLGGGFQYVPLEWNSGLHRTPVTHQEPRSQGETLLLV